MPQPMLTTARLLLRPLRPSDAGPITLWCGQFRVASMLARVPHPYPPGAAEAYIGRVMAARGGEMAWAMDATPSEGVEFLGVVALKGEAGDAVRGFGYWVGPPAWGLGYATEAAAAVATWAFADPAVAAIETTIYVDNHASRRVVQKLGFRVTGASEKFCPARNAVVAEDVMRLTRADFAARPGLETAA